MHEYKLDSFCSRYYRIVVFHLNNFNRTTVDRDLHYTFLVLGLIQPLSVRHSHSVCLLSPSSVGALINCNRFPELIWFPLIDFSQMKISAGHNVLWGQSYKSCGIHWHLQYEVTINLVTVNMGSSQNRESHFYCQSFTVYRIKHKYRMDYWKIIYRWRFFVC